MDDRTLDTLVRAAADEARASLGPHPSPEELVAYHAGELTATACEAVQEHLALCRECTAVVLAADEFLETDDTPVATTDSSVVAAGDTLPVRAGVPRIWAYSGWAVAATVVLVVGVFGRLYERVATRPEANVPVRQLTPVDPERERGDEATPETIRERASSIVLVLGVPDALHPPGRAEFVAEGATGKTLLTVDGLVPNAEGSVTLLVPLQQLPAGTYVVRLFGAAPSGKPVAEYALRLSPP